MSPSATTQFPHCLREARITAGYASRDTASTVVPASPETVGRHERGDVPVTPADAVMYAQAYRRPDILVRYCAGCPVGRQLRDAPKDREFALAAMRLNTRLEKAPQIAAQMKAIADDGSICEQERQTFISMLRESTDIVRAIDEITLWALTDGIVTPEEIKRTAR